MTPIPRPLLAKRQDLACAVAELESKAQAIREQLAVIEAAIAILAPGWKPPAGPARKRPVKVQQGASGAVARGDVARETIRVLKESTRGMTTSAIAAAIAASRGASFANAADRKRLTSAVLSALRRFEAKGKVEVAKRGGAKGSLPWSLLR